LSPGPTDRRSRTRARPAAVHPRPRRLQSAARDRPGSPSSL